MPMLDKSKLREDVRKLSEKSQRILMKGIYKFLNMEGNKGTDLMELMRIILDGNARFYEELASGEGRVEELYDLVTKDQMIFLARLFRYAMEFKAEFLMKKNPIPDDVSIEKINVNGVPAEWQIPLGAPENQVFLFIHGGGQVLGSPKSSRAYSVEIGRTIKMKVLSVDYRLAPEHPFPEGLEDCVKVYKWLLSTGIKAEDIIIAGASAGGNLTISTILKLRDEGIPLPSGAVALAPGIDYTPNSKTILENAKTDPVMADVGIFWWIPAYLNGADPNDPLISPVFADLKGFPPILLQVSKSEMIYDHSTRFFERAKSAGVRVVLQEWDDMPHVWHNYGLNELPEAKEAIEKIDEFIKSLKS